MQGRSCSRNKGSALIFKELATFQFGSNFKRRAMFLDLTDLQILNLLKENSRSKLTEIADKLKLTPAAIKYRIDRLVEAGIIDKFTILINQKKVGFEVLAFLIIYANSKAHLGTIINTLKQFPGISKLCVLMGDPDIIVELTLNHMNTLIDLLKRLNQIEEIQNYKIWIIQDIIHVQ